MAAVNLGCGGGVWETAVALQLAVSQLGFEGSLSVLK